MGDPIWVRSILYHSYHNVLREPDTFYQVDDAQDLETVLAQRVAVREAPPAKAQRQAPPTPPSSTPVKPMTSSDFTVGGVRHGTRTPDAK